MRCTWTSYAQSFGPGKVFGPCSVSHPVSGKMLQWVREVRRAKAPSPVHAIEVCAGSGDFARLVRRWTHVPVLQVDIIPRDDVRANETYIRASATALPFADSTFDVGISCYGIEYLGREGLRELRRVIRPGGSAVCLMHSAHSSTVKYMIAAAMLCRGLLDRLDQSEACTEFLTKRAAEICAGLSKHDQRVLMLKRIRHYHEVIQLGLVDTTCKKANGVTHRHMMLNIADIGERLMQVAFLAESHVRRFFEDSGFNPASVTEAFPHRMTPGPHAMIGYLVNARAT